jgi:hypothetical protein
MITIDPLLLLDLVSLVGEHPIWNVQRLHSFLIHQLDETCPEHPINRFGWRKRHEFLYICSVDEGVVLNVRPVHEGWEDTYLSRERG